MISVDPRANRDSFKKSLFSLPLLRHVRSPNIIVFGAVHVDAVVDRDLKDDVADAPGRVVHSVGGTAYNIATNLAINNPRDIHPALYSFVSRNTLFAGPIARKMRSSGVARRHLRRFATFANKDVKFGGFVGVRDKNTGDIASAGTDTAIEQLDFFAEAEEESRIKNLLKNVTTIVADTNLHKDTLAELVRQCKANQIDLVIMISSERKATKYSFLPDGSGWRCRVLGCKPSQLREIMREAGWDKTKIDPLIDRLSQPPADATVFDGLSDDEIHDLCELTRANYLVVAHRSAYHFLDFEHRKMATLAPPESITKVEYDGNLTGATDAIISGFIEFLTSAAPAMRASPTQTLLCEENCGQLRTLVNRCLGKIISERGATRGAELTYSGREFGDNLGRLRAFVWENYEWILTGIASLGTAAGYLLNTIT